MSQFKKYPEQKTNTFQSTLTKQQIKDSLKEYKQCNDISKVSIGTHLRYFTINDKKEKIFRLGGTLNKIDPELRFIKLSNGKIEWSVQIKNTTFYQKMTEAEIKEELKNELRKEIMTEECNFDKTNEIEIEYEEIKKENELLKKEIKSLNKKIDVYENMEKEYKKLQITMDKITQEIKKKKDKNKNN